MLRIVGWRPVLLGKYKPKWPTLVCFGRFRLVEICFASLAALVVWISYTICISHQETHNKETWKSFKAGPHSKRKLNPILRHVSTPLCPQSLSSIFLPPAPLIIDIEQPVGKPYWQESIASWSKGLSPPPSFGPYSAPRPGKGKTITNSSQLPMNNPTDLLTCCESSSSNH